MRSTHQRDNVNRILYVNVSQKVATFKQHDLTLIGLQDVEDMIMMKNPDWMSVMTYVSLIYNHFNGIRVGGPRLPAMPGQE